MTQEEKQLLLIDLCARLPYGVIAHASEINKNGIITDINISYNIVNLTIDNTNGKYEPVPLLDIKPYLRPMSSMTEEEANEWAKASNMKFDMEDGFFDAYDAHLSVDWLNKNMFDFRGLIPMGLALEAPENMYKTK